MKPSIVYDQDDIIIWHGLAEDVLRIHGPSSFDLVFTSPPYNLSGLRPIHSGSDWNAVRDDEDYEDAMPPAEYRKWQRSILKKCWGVLTESGAIFYNHKPILRDGVAHLPFDLIPKCATLRQVITWDRCAGHINVPWYFTPSYEWILVLAPEGFRLKKLGVQDVWRKLADNNTKHPAPFPASLPARAIDACEPRTVLDPFCGSGSTLVAAKAAGCFAVGIEKEAKYIDMAVERLQQGVLALNDLDGAPAMREGVQK